VERAYSSSRSLRLELPGALAELPPSRYLARTERVVFVAFPDESRRRRIDLQHWRVQLLPVQLLWLTAGVECTLRTWSDKGVLKLSGREVALTGLSEELRELAGSIALRVDGSLQERAAVYGAPASLLGSVRLRIAISLPDALALVPGVDSVVQGILDTVLYRVERSLSERLPADYAAWVAEESTARRPTTSLV
jgi:hypothetical protein